MKNEIKEDKYYCDDCGEELKNFTCLNKNCNLYLLNPGRGLYSN